MVKSVLKHSVLQEKRKKKKKPSKNTTESPSTFKGECPDSFSTAPHVVVVVFAFVHAIPRELHFHALECSASCGV